MPVLCLGSAQFGLKYGLLNQTGQITKSQIPSILDCFVQFGGTFIDTAQSYGESEKVLGASWDNCLSAPKFISKLRPQEMDLWSDHSAFAYWDSLLYQSLDNLRVDKLDTLLLHRPQDLNHPNGHLLLDWLLRAKSRMLVDRIGVSIYDFDEIPPQFLATLDVVQMPLSIFDQRPILNGYINQLNSLGCAIHVRSIFLQGITLAPAGDHLPTCLTNKFIHHHMNWLKQLESCQVTQLQASLAFCRQFSNIECIVVGIDSLLQLNEITEAWHAFDSVPASLLASRWAWSNIDDIDPRRWAQK
jgi:aryl-alcohol dehydrogenase-like predicted oxidoreductase